MRFEWHPENEDPYKVQLSLLGEMLGPSVSRIPTHQIPPPYLKTKRYYSETGHTISYGFLEYFDAHGVVVGYGGVRSHVADRQAMQCDGDAHKGLWYGGVRGHVADWRAMQGGGDAHKGLWCGGVRCHVADR